MKLLVRITLATTGPLQGAQVQHQLVELDPATEGPGRFSIPMELAPETDRIAVVVEDLDTGRWGSRMLGVSGL